MPPLSCFLACDTTDITFAVFSPIDNSLNTELPNEHFLSIQKQDTNKCDLIIVGHCTNKQIKGHFLF